MGEKRQIFLTEESQILYMYMCIHIIVCIFPTPRERTSSPSLLVFRLNDSLSEKRVWKGKKYLYNEEIWQILPLEGRKMPFSPKCLHPNPHNLWLILYMAKDMADMIKLRTLRWGDYPGLPRRVQCNHKGYKRNQSKKRICDYASRGWSDALWRYRKVTWSTEHRWPLEAGKGKKRNPPWRILGFWPSEL